MTPEQEARTLWWFHLVFGGALVGAAVAIVKSGRVSIALRRLASARRGWDAARTKSQRTFPGKKFKPGPWDHWTDEELVERAKRLMMGPDENYSEGAWYDLDRAWSELVSASPNCEKAYNHFTTGIGKIRTAKSISDTGRIDRFAKVRGYGFLDWKTVRQRVGEVAETYQDTCRRGPALPSL